MSKEEMERIWNALTVKYRVLAKACYYLQLRPAEAVRIQLKDIKEGFLVIPAQKNGNVNEAYPIPQVFMKDLTAYCHLFRQEILDHNGYLFWSWKHDKHLGVSSLYLRFQEARKKAGLDEESVYMVDKVGHKRRRITVHAHKAEAIRKVYNKTKDIIAAQSTAHHKCMKSTMRYLGDPTTNIELKKDTVRQVWEED